MPRRTLRRPLSPIRRNMRLMSGEAFSVAAMVGAGEAYIVAFALALGFSEVVAGLLGTVPLLAGALLQMAAPRGIQLVGSLRRWVVLCVALQSLSFMPLVVAAFLGAIPLWALFVFVSIYWTTGMSAGPAWNSWAETLLPTRIRSVYMSKRARLVQIGVIVGLAGGGVLLDLAKKNGRELMAFGILFLTALGWRALSARCLYLQDEGSSDVDGTQAMPLRESLRAVGTGHGGRMLIYLVAAQAAVQVSGPFFTPYMLKQIHLTYIDYLILMAAAFLGKMIFFPAMGRLGRKIGAVHLLCIGALAITPMPLLWTISDNVMFLSVMQFISGACWAIYEMASILVFFDSIKREERTSVLALFNLGNCLAMVIGSLAGGALLNWLGETHGSYHVLFAISAVGRLLAISLLWRMPETVGSDDVIDARPMGIRPAAGAILRPVLMAVRTRTGRTRQSRAIED